MDFIFILIVIFISILNGLGKQKNRTDRIDGDPSAWGGTNQHQRRRLTMTGSIHDMERVMNEIKSRTVRKARDKDEEAFQKAEQERRRREQEERSRREAEAERKRLVEQRKKEVELKKKQQEQAQKEEKARKAQQMEQNKNRDIVKGYMANQNVQTVQTAQNTQTAQNVQNDRTILAKEIFMEEKNNFRLDDYLDPLTASFYPGNRKEDRAKKEDSFKMEDYLFPTIAPFYPDVDISSFSLQNPPDMI